MVKKLEVGDKLVIESTLVNNENLCNIELHKKHRRILLAFGIPLESEKDLIKNLKLINVF